MILQRIHSRGSGGTEQTDSRFVLRQVVVHHHHDLLVRDPVPVHDLVGMAGVGLGGEGASGPGPGSGGLCSVRGGAGRRVSHLVPVVVPAVGAGHDHHPVLPSVGGVLGGEGGRQSGQRQQEEARTHVSVSDEEGTAPLSRSTVGENKRAT